MNICNYKKPISIPNAKKWRKSGETKYKGRKPPAELKSCFPLCPIPGAVTVNACNYKVIAENNTLHMVSAAKSLESGLC